VPHSVHTRSDSDGYVIEVGGDVDSGAADDLGAALASAVAAAEPTALVVVDLSGANFLDSRSIGILAEWQARVRASRGRLAIVGARPEVVRLFTMIGLEQSFEFFATRDQARAAGDSRAK
jgi:anti-anti-sigma factor